MIELDVNKLQNDIRVTISKIIEVAPEKIEADTHFIEDLGADSMMALEIMAALEKKYHINIPEDDLPKLATLRQVTELVRSLLPS